MIASIVSTAERSEPRENPPPPTMKWLTVISSIGWTRSASRWAIRSPGTQPSFVAGTTVTPARSASPAKVSKTALV